LKEGEKSKDKPLLGLIISQLLGKTGSADSNNQMKEKIATKEN
jgi:hypothetical protein